MAHGATTTTYALRGTSASVVCAKEGLSDAPKGPVRLGPATLAQVNGPYIDSLISSSRRDSCWCQCVELAETNNDLQCSFSGCLVP
jgi:hypothetical protein